MYHDTDAFSVRCVLGFIFANNIVLWSLALYDKLVYLRVVFTVCLCIVSPTAVRRQRGRLCAVLLALWLRRG